MHDQLYSWFSGIDTGAFVAIGWRIVATLLIFIVGRWVSRALVAVLRKQLSDRKVDALVVNFVGTIVYVVLLASTVMIALNYLGISVTPLIAILGGMAIAVGVALQGSLSNFASGIMLVGLRPFTTGDYVEAGGVSGTVDHVNIFHTELVTPDKRHVVVPNRLVTGAAITNYSRYDTRRIDLVMSVGYDDDLRRARQAIHDVLDGHGKVLADPAPTIMLLELSASSVDFAVRPWVAASDYWPVRGELLEQLKNALESAGCSIPFPQQDVHLFNSVSAADA